MELTFTMVVVFLALLIALSATYNAYLLRGGKLAMSEVLIVFGMISLILSVITARVLVGVSKVIFFANLSLADVLFILGLIFFLTASVRLRSSLRVK